MSPKAQPHHTPLDAKTLREAVEAHQRYIAGRSGGRRLSLTYADLSNCALEGVDLREADFAGANFTGASLARANLAGAILFGADLREADLRRANLKRADLRGACLRGANLANAELPGCDLREGRIALQDKLDGFRIIRHEHRRGRAELRRAHRREPLGRPDGRRGRHGQRLHRRQPVRRHAGRRQADARRAGRRRPVRTPTWPAPTSPAPP